MPINPSKSPNEQLRELVEAAGMTQAEALEAFNQGLGPAAYSMVTWKAFFASPDSKKHRKLKPALLEHAKAKIQPTKK
jgi:phage I-like protein